jgi:hypothetical protein
VRQLTGRRRGRRGEAKFRIGARVRLSRAGYPLGSLSATREQLIVRTGFGTQRLDRACVESVYRARRVLRKAILFQTTDKSGDWVHVYSPTPHRVLAALEDLGWPVDQL